ncbi:Rrf2 family transcriptional regulator [Natrarchaeobius chitinivorans]|uniref:TrmB family transcriptional regulator n=1 Tax=Natrarchaeobius chitinivorans TaxID=1679083 RepID=A0A3N6PDM1_NATCH|nr:Rrf2 family transcriptional regulator [Natrarchaeobius chitinivorans]RQG97759.1 TrmB family transcriptional regulator [Natrarchaeobius chitinivorans]
MPTIDLTNSQRAILSALINDYQGTDAPVPAKTIAAAIDREPRTVRNQMSNLSALKLVESVSGPHGGYEPTDVAYEVLDRNPVEDPETAVLAQEFDRVDAVVDTITFTNVHHPDVCRVRIRFLESVQGFDEGDAIAIGTTSTVDLLLAGEVEAVEPSRNRILLDVARLETVDRDDE